MSHKYQANSISSSICLEIYLFRRAPLGMRKPLQKAGNRQALYFMKLGEGGETAWPVLAPLRLLPRWCHTLVTPSWTHGSYWLTKRLLGWQTFCLAATSIGPDGQSRGPTCLLSKRQAKAIKLPLPTKPKSSQTKIIKRKNTCISNIYKMLINSFLEHVHQTSLPCF